MQMDVLRGLTPDIVHKEIWAHLLAYNLIRSVMAEAAFAGQTSPQTLSFKGTLQTLLAFQPFAGQGTAAAGPVWNEALLQAILSHRLPDRPGRYEPRARKRRPKPSPWLQVSRDEARKRKLYPGK
jgi:hypothetical protein